MDSANYRLLLKNSLLAFALCTVLILFCYYLIDRPIAFYVYQHHINQHGWVAWPSHLPELLFVLAPWGLLLFVLLNAWHKNSSWLHSVFLVSLSIIIAATFKTELKILFGRYWPLTWKNNLSLMQNNLYGFNFFHGGDLNNSFPSGHATTTFAALLVVWFIYPKLRWLWGTLSALVVLSVIGMDFHFLSDVVAGALVGGLCGYYTVALSRGIK